VASIPYVGPVLAAIAYAARTRSSLAACRVISAERGAGEVPADGTMAVLHQEGDGAPGADRERRPRDGDRALRWWDRWLWRGGASLRHGGGCCGIRRGAAGRLRGQGRNKPIPVTAAQPLGVTNDGGSAISHALVRSSAAVDTQPASGSRATPVEIVKGNQKVEVVTPAGRPVFVHQVQMAGGPHRRSEVDGGGRRDRRWYQLERQQRWLLPPAAATSTAT